MQTILKQFNCEAIFYLQEEYHPIHYRRENAEDGDAKEARLYAMFYKNVLLRIMLELGGIMTWLPS